MGEFAGSSPIEKPLQFITRAGTMCSYCEPKPKELPERELIQYPDGRPTSSFSVRKADKKKGRKNRLDELNQAVKDFWQVFEWEEDAKARAAACKTPGHKGAGWVCFHGLHTNWLKEKQKKMDRLFLACQHDGFI